MTDNKGTVPDILLTFAKLLGANVINHRLVVPEAFGTGYCTGYQFNKHVRLVISNYTLNDDVEAPNQQVEPDKKVIFFKFQNIFEGSVETQDSTRQPSVLIGTSRINTDDVIAIHTNTATINIEVDAAYLREVFDADAQSPIIQTLLQNTRPLLFEQLMFPSLQRTVNEIIGEAPAGPFELFYLKIKSEELVCRLLIELEKRDEKHLYPLNPYDIQRIYQVKEKILKQLNTPPVISDLSQRAGMSPTKLKRLFKQVFGDSIFSYYQSFRIKEAARLLRDEGFSVSQAGYQVGFTNMSHFSRVFKEYMGIKPKQFSRSV